MEELEYKYIRHKLQRLTGIDLNCYKAPQMQRRLKAYLMRTGYPNWPKFFQSIQDDPVALNKFRDYLTINVSSFLRDLDKYNYLQTSILPELLHSRATLWSWSAGCARGQEAYSLAMLLAEASGTLDQHRILATDIDRSTLDWARAGGPYTADDIANVPADWLQCYFDFYNNGYWVNEFLRRRITFRHHNLLSDSITGKFDLIICRNVVIYFQPDVKRELYHRFYEALRPGGVLFVGGTEIVPKAADIGFETVNISFYRRPDTTPRRLRTPLSYPASSQ